MTRNKFYQLAVLALASNQKMISDRLSIEQCATNIISLAEILTIKVEENTIFDIIDAKEKSNNSLSEIADELNKVSTELRICSNML